MSRLSVSIAAALALLLSGATAAAPAATASTQEESYQGSSAVLKGVTEGQLSDYQAAFDNITARFAGAVMSPATQGRYRSAEDELRRLLERGGGELIQPTVEELEAALSSLRSAADAAIAITPERLLQLRAQSERPHDVTEFSYSKVNELNRRITDAFETSDVTPDEFAAYFSALDNAWRALVSTAPLRAAIEKSSDVSLKLGSHTGDLDSFIRASSEAGAIWNDVHDREKEVTFAQIAAAAEALTQAHSNLVPVAFPERPQPPSHVEEPSAGGTTEGAADPLSEDTKTGTQPGTEAPDGRLELALNPETRHLFLSSVRPTIDGEHLTDGFVMVPGQTLSATVDSLRPGTMLTVELHSDPIRLATVKVGADGKAAYSAVLPEDVPAGKHTLRVSFTLADGTPVEQAIPVTVDAGKSASGGGPQLAATGFASSFLPVGITALMLGMVLLFVGKLRVHSR